MNMYTVATNANFFIAEHKIRMIVLIKKVKGFKHLLIQNILRR
jgi:hypothetical protein